MYSTKTCNCKKNNKNIQTNEKNNRVKKILVLSVFFSFYCGNSMRIVNDKTEKLLKPAFILVPIFKTSIVAFLFVGKLESNFGRTKEPLEVPEPQAENHCLGALQECS